MDLAIFHTNSPLFRPWLKFLVKVLIWFKGFLMLPKHFRWTVLILNFDTMTHFDEIRNKYCCFWCLDLFHTNLLLFKPLERHYFAELTAKLGFLDDFALPIFFTSNKLAFSSCFVSGCVSWCLKNNQHDYSIHQNIFRARNRHWIISECLRLFISLMLVILLTILWIPGMCIYWEYRVFVYNTCISMYITFFL